jgi:hypothetical protein
MLAKTRYDLPGRNDEDRDAGRIHQIGHRQRVDRDLLRILYATSHRVPEASQCRDKESENHTDPLAGLWRQRCGW